MFIQFSKKCKDYSADIHFVIDSEDYEKHFKGKTFYKSMGYVMCQNKGIHRTIMETTDSKIHIDHINGDPLDNRRENLREATPQQNSYNKNIYKNNKTGFTGVHFYKPLQKYMAYIKSDNKRKHLGYYKTVEEAYTAYVHASQSLHGDFAPQRVKDKDVSLYTPVPKVYKSPQHSINNYYKNRDVKLRNQIIRNVKKTGSKPKDTTLQKHNIQISDIQEYIKV